MILDSSGNPITIQGPLPKPVPLPTAPFHFSVTRQLKRAYLRQVAISHINKHYGGEIRKIRRSISLSLAKRPAFIAEVKGLTGAF